MKLEENLIELVRGKPFLYDKSHKDYKKNDKRDKAWEDIGKQLNMTGDATKKRWRTIRDRYNRLKEKHNLPSGSGGERGKLKNYKFYEMLSFLNNCSSVNKNTHCSYDEPGPSSFAEIIEEVCDNEIFDEDAIFSSTIQGEEESQASTSNELNSSVSYSEERPLLRTSTRRGSKQRGLVEEVLIKNTNAELLNLMRNLKDDVKNSSKEAAFCDSLRMQMEEVQLPADRFMQFQVKVLQLLSEEMANE